MTLLFFLVLVHFYGASTWWLYRFHFGLWTHYGLAVATAVLIALAIGKGKDGA